MSGLSRLLNIISPPACELCGAQKEQWLCSACVNEVMLSPPSRCALCLRVTQNYSTCKKCIRNLPARHVWVATEYESDAKELIKLYKYGKKQYLARDIAKSMVRSLPFGYEPSQITFVPTSSNRIRARGYDHAKLLAHEAAKSLGQSPKKLLARTNKNRQVGAGGFHRRRQLGDAFRPVGNVSGRVLLVDDVFTTGTTVSECVKQLKIAGAKEVDVLVFAQST